jgi:hypothetical protein
MLGRRRRNTVSLTVAVLALGGLFESTRQGTTAHAVRTPACYGERDRLWTTDTTRDWVSFSDQLSVVRVLSERALNPSENPTSGYIGRQVTLGVERTYWRRDGAPTAPAEFVMNDWGWCQTPQGRVPMLLPRVTRLRVGRTYLAPITRYRDAWSALDDGRLRLRGTRVAGGVDYGRPTFAHQTLLGLRVGTAAAVVRRTRPYRAAVRLRSRNPTRRWNAVDRDGYRVAGRGTAGAVTVAMGRTPSSRWTLYARHSLSRRVCVGIRARPHRRLRPAIRREACFPRPTATQISGNFFTSGRGRFAYGTAGDSVAAIDIGFGAGTRDPAPTYPSQAGLPGRDRFWVVPVGGHRRPTTIRALDRAGHVLDEGSID